MLMLKTVEALPFSCECARGDSAHTSQKVRYNLHWGFGNGKLKKDGIASFNIPAFRLADGFKTCPMAGSCALVCYALGNRYNMSNVKIPRDHNIAWLRTHSTSEFVDAAVEDINRLHKSWTRIRIHDSGDFYSEAYLDAWLDIAKQCPDMEFYAYTKMISLVTRKREILPQNFTVVQSVGGMQDRLIDKAYPHSVIFTSHDAMHRAGYEDGTKSDRPAFKGQIKIGLVYHGTKKLTKNNKGILDARVKAIGE